MANDFFEGNQVEKAKTNGLINEVENYINENMLPHLEKTIMADIKFGGMHDIAKSTSNNNTVIKLNNDAYCGYRALNMPLESEMGFQRPTSYLTNGRYPYSIIEECYGCFKDYKKLMSSIFAEKYNPTKILKGADTLLSSIIERADKNPLEITGLVADIVASGNIVNANDFKLEVLSFLMEGTEYPVSFKDGKIVLYDVFNVDDITICMNLKRSNPNENLMTDICTIGLVNKERGANIAIDTRFNEELSKKYGEMITHGVFAECLELLKVNATEKKTKKGIEYE